MIEPSLIDSTVRAMMARTNHKPGLVAQVRTYMLVQYMPRPARYPTRGGGWRAVPEGDSTQRAAARFLGLGKSTVRYRCERVEDMRDDPAFDALMTEIEDALDELPQTA